MKDRLLIELFHPGIAEASEEDIRLWPSETFSPGQYEAKMKEGTCLFTGGHNYLSWGSRSQARSLPGSVGMFDDYISEQVL